MGHGGHLVKWPKTNIIFIVLFTEYSKFFIFVHINLFAPQTSDFLEKLVLIFPYNIHRGTQFAKFENKKVIAENQCEKHKKIEFSCQYFLS